MTLNDNCVRIAFYSWFRRMKSMKCNKWKWAHSLVPGKELTWQSFTFTIFFHSNGGKNLNTLENEIIMKYKVPCLFSLTHLLKCSACGLVLMVKQAWITRKRVYLNELWRLACNLTDLIISQVIYYIKKLVCQSGRLWRSSSIAINLYRFLLLLTQNNLPHNFCFTNFNKIYWLISCNINSIFFIARLYDNSVGRWWDFSFQLSWRH